MWGCLERFSFGEGEGMKRSIAGSVGDRMVTVICFDLSSMSGSSPSSRPSWLVIKASGPDAYFRMAGCLVLVWLARVDPLGHLADGSFEQLLGAYPADDSSSGLLLILGMLMTWLLRLVSILACGWQGSLSH